LGLGVGGSGAKSYRPIPQRSELDRWILSELNRTCATVIERMDAYDNYGACQQITEFVDALSNWYVRRSRDRFWAADKRDVAKLDAYWTLYECLVTTTKLVAPFVPFIAETIWQNLKRGTGSGGQGDSESVHLCDYPQPDSAAIDEALSVRMNLVREIVSLGRNARMTANLKVRQPIAKVEVVLTDNSHEEWLNEHAGLIKEELNVKDVVITGNIPHYVRFVVLPNLKQLGPRLGKRLPRFKEWLANEGELAGNMMNALEHHGTLPVVIDDGLGPVHVTKDDFIVRLEAEPGWSAAKGPSAVVILDAELTHDLLIEGRARELVRLIQDSRKDIGCEYTDRIEVGIATESVELRQAIESFSEYIVTETLATRVVFDPLPNVPGVELKLGDAELKLFVRVLR
jgi:isoleucyl-tRNA synthetase